MTKRNLLLVSLLLVFGIAAAALAASAAPISPNGVVFYGSNNTNYFMRSEGDAEGTGTITLSTQSTGTIKKGSAFYITYNAPIAHNGTAYAVEVICNGDYNAAVCADITPFTIATAAFHSTPPYPVQGTPAGNQVVLTFANDIVLGSPSTGTSINVAVRLMVQNYPANYEVIATVRAFYQNPNYPMTTAPLYDAAYTVGELGPSQALTVGFKDGPAHVLTCIGVKDIDYYDNTFSLRFTENWPNALTSLSDEWNLENDTITNGPTNGSDILVTFTNLPPGVGISETGVYSCAEYPSGPHGCPGGALVISYVSSSGVTCPASTAPLCTESFLFSVDQDNSAVIEGGVLKFALSSHGPLMPNQNYQIVATISLANGEPSTDMSGGIPYFTTTETPTLSVVEFADCVTKLLFPYINTFQYPGSVAPFSHFGTGIDFANTTWDPWNPNFDTAGLYADEAKGSAVPQSGSCAVYLYPANETTTQLFVTPIISAGGSYSFDVANSAPGFAGNTGYAIAVCGFQNAYGFAEIYDNFGDTVGTSAPGATLGYLAYILPNPAFYHRSPAGDGLGESAIAPYNINKMWEKILMYGLDSCCGGMGGYKAAH